MLQMHQLQVLAKKIKLMAFDVDGVLTDGKIVYSSDGEELKFFNVKDGIGISSALEKGLIVAIITSRNSATVKKRAQELKIPFVFQGVKDKKSLLHSFLKDHHLKTEEVFYMGDDLPDIPLLKTTGIACCPSDAVDEVKQICHYVTQRNGGDGAVREAIDFVIKQRLS